MCDLSRIISIVPLFAHQKVCGQIFSSPGSERKTLQAQKAKSAPETSEVTRKHKELNVCVLLRSILEPVQLSGRKKKDEKKKKKRKKKLF